VSEHIEVVHLNEVGVTYLVKWDEEVKAFVGYVPLLQRFTQAQTRDNLAEAVEDMIDSLDEIMAQRGWPPLPLKSGGSHE